MGQLGPRGAGEWEPRVPDPGCLSYRWTVELKEPGLRLGQGRRRRPLVGEQENSIFPELQRASWGAGGGQGGDGGVAPLTSLCSTL